MEEMSDEQTKRSFAFDAYGRHTIVKDIINANRGEGEKFRILDVGAGQQDFMRMFLPDDDVYSLDPHIDSVDSRWIEGDGCNIPLEDGSFDFVLSSDVFEHVKPSDRDRFLSENLRVASRAVILGAPFYSPETELAEIYANENFKIISKGKDHAWLKEHIDNGLPTEQEVEARLAADGYAFQKIPNNNIRLWESLVFSTFIDHGKSVENFWQFNHFYNDKLFPYDHDEESYRKIYFIKKDKSLKDLELREGGIDSRLYLEAIKNNLSLFSHVYVEHKDRIAVLEEENRRQHRELKLRQRELDLALAEIDRIHDSRSWKVTRPLRQIRPLAHRVMQVIRWPRAARSARLPGKGLKRKGSDG